MSDNPHADNQFDIGPAEIPYWHPKRSLRNHVEWAVDKALQTVVGDDEFWWDLSFQLTAQGPVCYLAICAKSPMLGGPTIMSIGPVDALHLVDEERAVRGVRILVENIRRERAKHLTIPNGG